MVKTAAQWGDRIDSDMLESGREAGPGFSFSKGGSTMADSDDPVVSKQTYAAAPAAVWDAITNGEKMPRWFFRGISEFRPEVGFETQFDVSANDRVYRHLWRVTEVVPVKKIAYTWRFEGTPGDSTVHWELDEVEGGTRLVLTQEIHEPFPADDPAFTREAGQGGWDYFVGQTLSEFLAGNESPGAF